MKYYQIEPSFSNAYCITENPNIPKASRKERNIYFNDGTVIDKELPDPLVHEVNYKDDMQPAPFLKYMYYPVVNDAFVTALQQAGVQNFQLFPAVLRNSKTGKEWAGYHVLNVTGGLRDAVDMEASRYDSFGGSYDFHELVLDAAKLADKPLMFLLKQNKNFYVSGELLEMLKSIIPLDKWNINPTLPLKINGLPSQLPDPAVSVAFTPDDWIKHGDVLLKDDYPDDACQCFEKAIALNDSYAPAYHALGRALAQLCKRDEAEKNFLKATTLDPTYAEPWMNLGMLALDRFRGKAATEYFLKADAIVPLSAAQWKVICHEYYKYSQGYDAIPLYRKLAALESGDAEVWNELGKAYADSSTSKTKDAIACWEKATALDPKNIRAWKHLADQYRCLERHKKAVECYQHIITLEPKNVDARHRMGQSLTKLRRYDEAFAAFEYAIAQKTDHCGTWYELGVICNELGKHEKAIEYYEKSIALQDDYAEPFVQLGKTYARFKQYEKAINAFEKAAAMDGNSHKNDTLLLLIGKQYEAMRNDTAAIETYQQAIEQNSHFYPKENDEPYYRIGRIYARLGDMKKAIENFKQALALNSEHNAAGKKLQSIQRKK